MSNLGSESEVLDLEKGKGSDPGTATASASLEHAAAVEDEDPDVEDEDPEVEDDPELVTDPWKAGLVKFLMVVSSVLAISVLVWSVYHMDNGTLHFWEGFGLSLSAVCFITCALSIGTVLLTRRPLISCADDATSSGSATSIPISDSGTSTPSKLWQGLGFSI